MNKSMHGSSVRSFSINNLNAKLEILLRFRVNDLWKVGCYLVTAVFTRMRLNGFYVLSLEREQEVWQEVCSV